MDSVKKLGGKETIQTRVISILLGRGKHRSVEVGFSTKPTMVSLINIQTNLDNEEM